MKLPLRLLTLSVVLLLFCETARAQGVLFRGIGAVNEGFGGASTAAPLDAAGAIYWNPATISALQHSEMQFGMGVVMSQTKVSSTMPNVPPGYPLASLAGSGSTDGSAGAVPSPNAAMVWKIPNKRWTLGFLFAGVGGASTMYPYDFDNPIMRAAQGARTSNVQILQVMPTASYQLTRRLSFGFTPVVDMGKLEIHPSAIAGSNQPTGTRYIWGAGFHTGLFYQAENCFNYGFTVKSPQWIENIMVYDKDPTAPVARSHAFDLDIPLILSLGVSYTGFRDTIWAIDFRYFDWGNTVGFRDVGWDNNGKFIGLGWESIFSVAMGVERKVNDRLRLRAGYCFNENPVPDRNSMYNVAAPLIMEHTLSCGGSWTFAKDWDLAIAYSHAFANEISGSFYVDGQAVPGSNVTNKAGADILNASVIKRF